MHLIRSSFHKHRDDAAFVVKTSVLTESPDASAHNSFTKIPIADPPEPFPYDLSRNTNFPSPQLRIEFSCNVSIDFNWRCEGCAKCIDASQDTTRPENVSEARDLIFVLEGCRRSLIRTPLIDQHFAILPRKQLGLIDSREKP